MGTSLTGKNISSTYLGLLKTTDNAVIGSTAKRLTDGNGTDSPLYLSTSKLGIGVSPSVKLHIQESDVSVTPNAEHLLVVEKDGNSGIGIYSGSTSQGSLDFGDSSDANAGRILYTHNDNAMSFSTNGSAKMTIASTGQTKLNNYGSGTFTGTVTQRLGVTSAGQVVEIPIGGGAVDGSGTAGKITKWTDSDTIGDSIMSESGSTISIVDTLKINATTGDSLLQFNITGDTYSMGIDNSDEDKFKLAYGVFGSTDLLAIDVDGNSIFSGRLTINKESSSALTISNPSATNDYLLIGHDASLNSLYTSRAENSYGTHTFRQWDGSTTRNILTLDASQNATFEGTITSTSTSTNTLAGKLRINGTTTTGLEIASSSSSSSGLKLYNNSTTDNAYIYNHFDGNLEIGTNNATVLTMNGTNATFAGDVALTGSGAKIISAISSDNDSSLFLSGAGSGKDTHIVFGGDRNLYLSKSSSATAVSEGTPVLTLGSNSNATFAGNVGIGTTSPTGFKLVVENTSEDLLKLHNSTDGLDSLISFTNAGGTLGRIQGIDNGGLAFDTGNNAGGINSNAMFINNAGNVGIGTTSPSSYNSAGNHLVIAGTGNTGLTIAGGTSNDSNIFFADGTSGADAYRGILRYQHSDNSMLFFTDATERLRIDSSGQITNTMSGGQVLTDTNGHITSFQTLDTATAGGRFIGKSNRGVLGSIHIEQTATSADGGYIGFETSPSGSTTPSERMRITSAGHVGIGETSPGAPLHVVNEATSDNGKFQRWAYTSGSSAYVLDLKQTVTSNVVRYNFSMINNGTAYNDVLVLDRGNVGIGTTSPQQLFHINNSSGDFSAEAVIRGSTSTGTPKAEVAFKRASSGDGATLVLRSSNSSGTIADAVTIDTSQNVGIGTDSPGSILDVVDTSGTTTLTLGRSGEVPLITAGGHNTDLRLSAVGTGGFLDLQTNGSSRMLIQASGNVGIGTTLPQNILHLKSDDPKLILEDGNAGTNEKVYAIYPAGSQYVLQTQTDAFGTGQQVYVVDRTGTTVDSQKWYINNGLAMELDGSAVLQVGSATSQTQARLNVRENGSGIEFGHTNVSDYYFGTVGSYGSNGNPFISFSCMNEHNVNTWTTKSVAGNIIQGDASGNLLFKQVTATNTTGQTPTERMRITSNGDVLIGTTTTTSVSKLQLTSSNSYYGFVDRAQVSGTGFPAGFFNSAGSLVGFIGTDNTSTTYGTSSDYRLKEDLKDFNALDIASKIKMYDFKWKADDSRSYGVMAHELEEVLPQAVSGDKDAEDMQGVDYSKLVPILLKSIQELKAEIDELKKNK